MSTTAKQLAARAGFAVLVAAIAVWSLFPFYWALVSSLKVGADLFEADLVPRRVSFESYTGIFVEQPFGRNLLNSLIVASATVALAAALACFAAYALGRVRFRGRGTVLLAILGVSMFPQVAVLSGLFEVITWLRLYDNLGALVISYMVIVLPFMIWMLTTTIAALPQELEEAASLDGAGPAYVLTRIFVPLLAPAIAATGLLAFMTAWNEFLFALTFTLSNETRTVPVAIALISGASEHELPWGRIMAASVIVTLPLIALTIAFQRRIVSGLTAGAMGGE
jgi:trehalose/maltose transport system permease protein